MPKIKFIGTPGFPCYHDSPDFHDGEIREVEESKYQYLIANFPDNFFPITDSKSVIDKPNKMIEGKKNK